MKSLFQSKSPSLASAHQFTTLFNVEIPVPALQAGAMHRARHDFFISDNGIWLTGQMPPAFSMW